MRLINSNDVKELLIGLDSLPWEEEVDDLVDRLPTVEAKPVVHGEWIPRNPHNEDSERYCSKCKAEVSAIKAMYYKFCYECGCNMRGGKND